TFIPFNGEIGLKLIPKLAFLYDEPFADSSMLATHYVSDYASKHVKVVFCGDGGDELFAGYDRYPWIMNVVLPKVLPKFVAPLFINPVAGVFEKINYHPIFYKLGKHMRALAQPPYVRYEDILSFGDKKVRSEYSMLGVTSYYDLYRSYWQYPEELNNLMNIDWHQELHDDGLVKVDRASMGASIETAMPILDHSFVDYATKIPAGLKLKNGDKKYIFKMAMKDMLPLEIWKKKKHGFGVPVTEYFKKDWESYVHDTLLSNEFLSKPYLNQNGVRKIIEVHKSGKEDYSPAIWLFLMLEEFLKKWSY
ncbi:asparagine synthase C-terminal domain-containing protein, partial [Candidatus Woesearchaeota archaeon]|nr:asparagine synthase C-terminal domain-containing protein [Candidatus Woesearchaeota archaeon]